MITQESEGLTDTLVVPTPLTMSSIEFPTPSPIYLGKKKNLNIVIRKHVLIQIKANQIN